MKALVLAGGLGTRLREVAPHLPKPMIPVAGRPFLEYLLDRLIAGGISEIMLSVGYLADVIVNHFGNRYRSAEISYAVEDEPLGTGGAIRHALGGESSEPWLILNGDTLLDLNYQSFFSWYAKNPSDLAIVLRRVSDVGRYGAVKTEGEHVTGFLEKGLSGEGLINAGIYVLKPALMGALGLNGRFSFETDLLQPHAGKLAPRAYVSEDFFIDIGTPEDYERAQTELVHTK